MINSSIVLQGLLDKLNGLPGGKNHLHACPVCQSLRRHLSGRVMLNEAQLRNGEAHLLAQIAMRGAELPF